ncbi:MAG: glycosyltransferase family 39 protein [Paracoccaceae bacterium]
MFAGLTGPAISAEAADRAWFWRLLWVSLGLRVLLAVLMPMGVDEAYALAVAREFSISFFDHPPLGFWSPVLATTLSGIEHPFIYRLPTLIYGTLSMILLYGIGREIGGSRVGFFSALLYAVSPIFLLSGVIILPDGPLAVGSAFCVLWLMRIAGAQGPVPLGHWALVGAGLGVALASKYQAGLIPIATLVFMLAVPVGRRWFLRLGPYLAACIALIGLVPVLVWNLQNNGASFAFHGGRTGDGLNLDNLALMAGGQVAYLLPPVLVLAGIGLWRGLRSGRPDLVLLAIIALAPIVMFNAIYLISEASFPHWTMPGWLFALPLAAFSMSQFQPRTLKRAKIALIGFALPVAAIIMALTLHASTGVLTRFSQPAPPWDDTRDLFDYSALHGVLQSRGDTQGIDLIAAKSWITAGFMSLGMQGIWPVRVLNDPKHHFAFMSGETLTGTALLLDPQLTVNAPAALGQLLALAQRIDPTAVALKPVQLMRGGRAYVTVNVIRLNLGN